MTKIELCVDCGAKLTKKDMLAKKTLCEACEVIKSTVAVSDGAEIVQGEGAQTEGEGIGQVVLSLTSTEPTTAETLTPDAGAEPKDPPTEPPTPPVPPAEVTVRPGEAIRARFCELVEQGKITDEVIAVLTDKEKTAAATSIRYAFLKEFDSTKPIKELTYINGAARYTSKPIVVNGREFLVTNDLYAKTLPKFNVWADTLSK